MSTDEQNQAWREHLPTLIADGTLTPMTERIRLPGCKCPFPSQAAANHSTNCIHFRGDTTMNDFFGTPPSLPTCSGPSPSQIPAGGHPRSCPRYEAPSNGWSSTPPPSGDMLAKHPKLEDSLTVMTWCARYDGDGGWWTVNMPRCIGASPSETPAPDDGTIALVIGQACDHRLYTPTGARSVRGMAANGWQFRPLDIAAAPSIHQAAMVARMARTRIRIYTLSRPAGRTAEQQQPIADRLAADAHLWKDWAEWCQYHGNDDAGHEYDDLAEDCIRAVVDWQGAQ